MSRKVWWRLKLLFVAFLVGVAFQLLTMFSTEHMKDDESHIQSFNTVRLRSGENEVPVVIVDQHQEGLFWNHSHIHALNITCSILGY